MTYSSGNLIQATDYNGFVSTTVGANLNATWNTTYGQTALPTVSAGNTVTASGYWASLFSTIAAIGTHQGTAVTSRIPYPATGNIISANANVNTDLTNIYTNRFNANVIGAQFTGWTGTASFTTNIGNTGGNTQGAWTATFTDTITFANSNAANAFFACGGYAQIQFGKSSTGTVADTEWNTFIGAAGAGGVVAAKVILTSDAASKTIVGTTYQGTYKTGGTGTPTTLATGTGFNQLTTTPVTIYKQFDTGTAYSSNYVQVNASKNATGNVITLTTTWFDNGDTNIGSVTTITGGTATTGISFGSGPATVVTLYVPETTNISNVWGTYTVASSVANT